MLSNRSHHDLLSLVAGIGERRNPIMSATATGATFDEDSVKEILIRWTLAEEYVSQLDMDSLPSEYALRVLLRQDVPTLLSEVVRLRRYLE
jgi:hypothetical protein